MPNDLPNDDDLDLGGDYARERGWSGGGRRDEYTRGPRHYARPDEQIREEVNNANTEIVGQPGQPLHGEILPPAF